MLPLSRIPFGSLRCSSTGGIPVLAGAFAMHLIFPGALCAAEAPEYLHAEAPISGSLEEAPTATDNIGVTPESWTEMRGAYPLLPGQFLPALREKYVPKTGQPFIDDAVFSVRPRFYYRHVDNGDGSIAAAAAAGGALALESGWLQDILRVNLTGYTSQKLYGPEDRDGTGLLRAQQKSYTVLGEAFAEFKLGDSSCFAGRTRLDLPYINGNDSRMTPNTFQAAGVRTSAIPHLELAGGHLTRIKARNSSIFEPMSERAGVKGSDRGVSVIGLRYNFTEDLYIGIVDQYGWDMFNTFFLETDRLVNLTDDLSLRFATQFTDQRSVGEDLLGSFSTQSAGVKASLGYHGLIASTSFTWTAKGAGVMHPWGGSPSFNSAMISDFDSAGEKSIRAGASFDFTELGLKGLGASVDWLHGNTPGSGDNASLDENEIDFNVDYQPPVKGLQNFWLRVRYAVNDRDGGADREDFRVILNYSYRF